MSDGNTNDNSNLNISNISQNNSFTKIERTSISKKETITSN